MKFSDTKKIVLCEYCNGSGKSSLPPSVKPHDGSDPTFCYWCEGSGRLILTTMIQPHPMKPQ